MKTITEQKYKTNDVSLITRDIMYTSRNRNNDVSELTRTGIDKLELSLNNPEFLTHNRLRPYGAILPVAAPRDDILFVTEDGDLVYGNEATYSDDNFSVKVYRRYSMQTSLIVNPSIVLRGSNTIPASGAEVKEALEKAERWLAEEAGVLAKLADAELRTFEVARNLETSESVCDYLDAIEERANRGRLKMERTYPDTLLFSNGEREVQFYDKARQNRTKHGSHICPKTGNLLRIEARTKKKRATEQAGVSLSDLLAGDIDPFLAYHEGAINELLLML